MEIICEEFWKKIPLPAMFIITTNGIIGDNNELVMGTGVAREAIRKIKDLAKTCGKAIEEIDFPVNKDKNKYLYYFLPVLENEGKNFLGLFQVKLEWGKKADLDIVEKSCQGLVNYMDKHPEITYRMVYPAIGAGKMSIAQVQPILEKYFSDKKITFCMREESFSEYNDLYGHSDFDLSTQSSFCGEIDDADDQEMASLHGVDSIYEITDYKNYEFGRL